jgi:hypothetical protein
MAAVVGLSPLAAAYPDSPLSFLFPEAPSPQDGDILSIKQALTRCFDKYTEEATFLAATAIMIGFSSASPPNTVKIASIREVISPVMMALKLASRQR